MRTAWQRRGGCFRKKSFTGSCGGRKDPEMGHEKFASCMRSLGLMLKVMEHPWGNLGQIILETSFKMGKLIVWGKMEERRQARKLLQESRKEWQI